MAQATFLQPARLGLIVSGGQTSATETLVREFLVTADGSASNGSAATPPDAIPFYVLPATAVQAAILHVRARSQSCLNNYRNAAPTLSINHRRENCLMQDTLRCPALWVDEDDALAGQACLQLVYRLGAGPQLCELPFKPIALRPDQTAGPGLDGVACRAYVSSKLHHQLYRLTLSLFPILERLHQELLASTVQMLDAGVSSQPMTSVDQIRAMPVEQVRRMLLAFAPICFQI
jgi:hypothetical protein